MNWMQRLKRVFHIDIEHCAASIDGLFFLSVRIPPPAGHARFLESPGLHNHGPSRTVGSRPVAWHLSARPVTLTIRSVVWEMQRRTG